VTLQTCSWCTSQPVALVTAVSLTKDYIHKVNIDILEGLLSGETCELTYEYKCVYLCFSGYVTFCEECIRGVLPQV
jgi:hypothetical protein